MSIIQQYRNILPENTTTGNTYRSALAKIEQWYTIPDSEELRPIKENDLVDFVTFLREDGASESTIRLYISVFRKMLEWATAYKLLSPELYHQLEVNYKHGGKRRLYYRRPPINSDELNKILEYFAEAKHSSPTESSLERTRRLVYMRNRALLYTLATTGLRVSEGVALLREPFENLLSGWKGEANFILQIVGKGMKPRDVIFYPIVIRKIEDYLNQRGSDGYKYLFVSHGNQHTRSGKMGRTFVNKMLDVLTEELNITGTASGPHAFRHLFGDKLAQMGVSMETRQELLGHSSPATTKILYTHSARTSAIVKELNEMTGEEWK